MPGYISERPLAKGFIRIGEEGPICVTLLPTVNGRLLTFSMVGAGGQMRQVRCSG